MPVASGPVHDGRVYPGRTVGNRHQEKVEINRAAPPVVGIGFTVAGRRSAREPTASTRPALLRMHSREAGRRPGPLEDAPHVWPPLC
jgi:hypothetical protein